LTVTAAAVRGTVARLRIPYREILLEPERQGEN
jgi:hypothetical protein